MSERTPESLAGWLSADGGPVDVGCWIGIRNLEHISRRAHIPPPTGPISILAPPASPPPSPPCSQASAIYLHDPRHVCGTKRHDYRYRDRARIRWARRRCGEYLGGGRRKIAVRERVGKMDWYLYFYLTGSYCCVVFEMNYRPVLFLEI